MLFFTNMDYAKKLFSVNLLRKTRILIIMKQIMTDVCQNEILYIKNLQV